jgi:hypothetical protein
MHVPPGSAGALFLGDVKDARGSYLPEFDVKFHIDFLASSTVDMISMTSDASGIGSAAFRVPKVPSLAGTALVLQSVWSVDGAWANCAWTANGVVSSRGLEAVIQP